MRHLFGPVALLSAFLVLPSARAAAPPASAYAELPTASEPRLSPDGRAIAMVGTSNGRQAFVIVHLDGTPPKVFSAEGWIPEFLEWKSPTRLLALVRTSRHAENYATSLVDTRLMVLATDGSRIQVANAGGKIVSFLHQDPDHILIGGKTVWSYNTATDSLNFVKDSRSDVLEWMADPAGALRGGVSLYRPSSITADQHRWISYIARASENDDWHTVLKDPVNGLSGPDFTSFDAANPDRIIFNTNGPSGFRILQAFSISTGTPGAVIAQDSGADVSPIMNDQRLVGYKTQGTSETFHYLDAAWQHDAQSIAHALGDGQIELVDRTADGHHVLAGLHDGTLPVQYWLLDRTGGKTSLKLIVNQYEGFAANQVAQASWISYSARDGQIIHGLLTLPPGKPAGALPFVVFPHGGPHAHDEMGFDWIAQFMASRGYGVLQPEFRASTGFGKAILDGGFQQWGGTAQDDITDGARAMIARHIADPARIAIVGASFGGYSALEAAVREPALYKAAAALAPVTDLPLIEGGSRYFSRKDFYIPEAGATYDAIEAASPYHHVEPIRVPILIVHGLKDFTVPATQSKLMVRALKDAGKDVQALYLPDADHFMSDSADRLAWLQALEGFLAANIGSSRHS